ncbi:MAG: crossover junction endodeoxyribonuclease RuvC, partial [bacterium]
MKNKRAKDEFGSVSRILGVDPGLSSTGWGVIECNDHSYRLIAKGAISTTARNDFPSRLLIIHDAISHVIETYRPGILAIEKTIYAKNIQIALNLGHVRGLLILAAVQQHLEIVEYTPKEIKASITGNGNASKLQVQKMVQSLLALGEMPSPHDVADALAVALCRFHRR